MSSSSEPPVQLAPRASRRSLVIAGAAAVATIGALWWQLQSARPLPFATSGDSWFYFLPLLVSINERIADHAAIGLHWGLGQGWSPFESGQLGVGYPGYLVALLVARAYGAPEAMLEVSGLLHGLLAAVVVLARATRLPPASRAIAAVALAVQPGALLYGLGPHCYYSTLPWFAGATLAVWRVARAQPPGDEHGASAADRLHPWHVAELLAFEVMFFWTAHLQMFVVGNLLLGALMVAAAPSWRDAARGVLALGFSCAPSLLPMLWYVKLAEQMPPYQSASHGGTAFFTTSAPPWDMLVAIATGGYVKPVGAMAGWMYLNPLFLVLACVAVVRLARERDVRAALALAFAFFLLCPAVLPRAMWTDPVLLRLRDPGKTATLLGAVCLLALASLPVTTRRGRVGVGAGLTLALLLGVWADVEGHRQLPMPTVHDIGARRILDESRRCLAKFKVKRGARVAIVDPLGAFSVRRKIGLPLLGISANAPLLLGIGSAHLYEPLEPMLVVEGHARLGAPWYAGSVIDGKALAAGAPGLMQRLRDLGVTHLFSRDAAPLQAVGSPMVFVDNTGERTYAVELLPRPVSFPWALVDGTAQPLRVRADGTVETRTASATPPDSRNLTRSIRWTQRDDGRWRGTPELVGIGWWMSGFGLLAMCVAMLAWWSRHAASTAKVPP